MQFALASLPVRERTRLRQWLEIPSELVARSVLILAMLLAMGSILAGPLLAYEVALKDGRVLHFKKHHVAGSKLYFTDNDGRDGSVDLDSINLDATRQLNKNENPPLDLPGISRDQKDEATTQPSLGEIARQARANRPAATVRAFTNDDVKLATDEDRIQDWIKAGGRSSSSDPLEAKKIREKAVAFARASQRLNEQEVTLLALGRLGEIQFPGRDRWQVRLYAAHQRVYGLLETCVERTDEQSQFACSKIDDARTELESLKLDGIKRANAWKVDREK